MIYIYLFIGALLWRRETFGLRKFRDLPVFFHHTIACCYGATMFTLFPLWNEISNTYFELLRDEDASFLEVVLVSIVTMINGGVLYWFGFQFSRHMKVLIDRSLDKIASKKSQFESQAV